MTSSALTNFIRLETPIIIDNEFDLIYLEQFRYQLFFVIL